MSFFTTIESDLMAIQKWFNGNPVVQTIENDFRIAVSELSQIAVADLENAVKVIGLSALSALATGGTSAAIAAGIISAEAEFKSLGKELAAKTVTTLVTSIVNHVKTQTTPVPVVAP
jgi:hypothetical protein